MPSFGGLGNYKQGERWFASLLVLWHIRHIIRHWILFFIVRYCADMMLF